MSLFSTGEQWEDNCEKESIKELCDLCYVLPRKRGSFIFRMVVLKSQVPHCINNKRNNLMLSSNLPDTGRMMSMGSTSSLIFISGTAGPSTAERAPLMVDGGAGAATIVVEVGGAAGTAPGMVDRAAVGCALGLAAAMIVGMAEGGCWEEGGTAMVGCSPPWLDTASIDTVTGVAMDT